MLVQGLIASAARGVGAPGEIQNRGALFTLASGLSRVLIKVFDGCCPSGFRLRLEDPSGQPLLANRITLSPSLPVMPEQVYWLKTQSLADCTGPNDSFGNMWYQQEYNTSGWTYAFLDDYIPDAPSLDRFYRGALLLDSIPSKVRFYFSTHDGMWLYVNGTFVGHWGADCHEPGCVNNIWVCTYMDNIANIPPVDITPHLHAGENTIAVHVSNRSSPSTNNTALFTASISFDPGLPPSVDRQFVAKVGTGPNGNTYQIVLAPDTYWDDARQSAENSRLLLGDRTIVGHLATITSRLEDEYIEALRQEAMVDIWGIPELWVGGQQLLNQSATNIGWQWVNGEGTIPGTNTASGYANWELLIDPAATEPNDCCNPINVENNDENYLGIGLFGPSRGWNDDRHPKNIIGYVVEYDTGSCPITVPLVSQKNPLWATADFANAYITPWADNDEDCDNSDRDKVPCDRGDIGVDEDPRDNIDNDSDGIIDEDPENGIDDDKDCGDSNHDGKPCNHGDDRVDEGGSDTPDNYARWACAVTCCVMLINYVATVQQKSLAITPVDLNTWLLKNKLYTLDGQIPGAPGWCSIARYAREEAPDTINLYFQQSFDGPARTTPDPAVDEALCNGMPVILKVKTVKGFTHFVLATGKTVVKDTQTYSIRDHLSIDPNEYRTLELYNFNYYGFRRYSQTLPQKHPCNCQITTVVQSPVELLLVDPIGRRLGFDSQNMQNLTEIPDSSYYIEALGADDDTDVSAPPIKIAEIDSPIVGSYFLNLIGTDTGPYTISLFAYNNSGSLTEQSIEGVAENGSLHSFEATFDPSNEPPIEIRRKEDFPFRRGDTNQDGRVDLSDPIATLGHLFLGNPEALPCNDAADSNDDGRVDLSDAVYTLGFKFLGGPVLPAPGVDTCGADPSLDDLPICVYEPTKC